MATFRSVLVLSSTSGDLWHIGQALTGAPPDRVTDLALLGLHPLEPNQSGRRWPAGGSWGQSSAPLVALSSMQLCSGPLRKPSAVGRRTTSHRAKLRALLALQDREMITRAQDPSSGPWSASAASTLRVCLHACRVISVCLSGLSPYDRGKRPDCDFYTALSPCGSLLCQRALTVLCRGALICSRHFSRQKQGNALLAPRQGISAFSAWRFNQH